jgi:hypothetical protein
MITASQFRERIEQRIFQPNVVSTAIRKPFTSQTIDAWGDATQTRGADESIELIPYVYRVEQINHQPFGEFKTGDVSAIIRYSQELVKDDLVEYKERTYLVQNIVDYVYGNVVVAKAIRLVRQAS